MNWRNFFFLLNLIPILIYGLSEKKCTDIHNKIGPEWTRHNELIKQFNQLKVHERRQGLELLRESMECCKRAYYACEKILNDIANKSPSKRKKRWRIKLKELCKKEKDWINEEIHQIKNIIDQIESIYLAWDNANALYQKSVEKAVLADTKNQKCQRRLNNASAVILALQEIAALYEEALGILQKALTLLPPHTEEKELVVFTQKIQAYQELANKYKQEAADWPDLVTAQKTALKDRITMLLKDSDLFMKRGLKRNCYELQKQIVPLLQELMENSSDEEKDDVKKQLAELESGISLFEKEADANRLTNSISSPYKPSFLNREKERKECFFKSEFFLNPHLFLHELTNNDCALQAIPLDGLVGKKEGQFILYTEQFYRFFIQKESVVSELFINVYENEQLIHTETIALPLKNTHGWGRYLKEGMIFIPETILKLEFGLDLRFTFVYDLRNRFSMIVAQKGTNPRYQFSLSLDQNALYKWSFSPPPPWQLGALRKPALAAPHKPIEASAVPNIKVPLEEANLSYLETIDFPILDQLVEELKKDPLALASYVQNEIAFNDPHLFQQEGIFQAPSIHKNPCITYLEGQGSAWEQCQLLVYLLRKAGYQAVYAIADSCSLPKDFVERMLFTTLPEGLNEVFLKYPWVVFFDGKEWISLFPWMKEFQIHEGYNLYNVLPEEYANADRWILRYLKGDENILKHIGLDEDDTAGVLFVRFLEETLKNQGLSLSDIGIQRTQLKMQFGTWQDFPHPSIQGQLEIHHSLGEIQGIFTEAQIEITSRQNPQNHQVYNLPLACLSSDISAIHFTADPDNLFHFLHLQIAGQEVCSVLNLGQGGQEIYSALTLGQSDHVIDIKITCNIPLGAQLYQSVEQTFSIAKGTNAALCSHFGGASPKISSWFYDRFSVENNETKRLAAFLSSVGAAYFEKCSRTEKNLADLHKIYPATFFAFGLCKLCPDPSTDSMLPQVDMFWFRASPPSWHSPEFFMARMQYEALAIVDSSSNEHQILRDVFNDSSAISTVKLLQLAHQKHQEEEEGFLHLHAANFEVADNMPEAAQSMYFSHLKDLNLREIKTTSHEQWILAKKSFDASDPFSNWSYAYMTPGPILNQNSSYKEMGTLLLCPYNQYALISHNNLLYRGGLGSPLSSTQFSSSGIDQWKPVPTQNGYALQLPKLATASLFPPIFFQPETNQWKDDVRPGHNSWLSHVADPVDTITGAFYVDEIDLILPGLFPLAIRRNYSSQNSLMGNLGCGWKLGFNYSLIEQDGKKFAAEADGTVLVYHLNPQNQRWEVSPEDNPHLYNFNGQNIKSNSNPFHAYIENDVLYGADKSKRFFEDGLLKKWINARGNTLTFLYDNERLSRIESDHEDFCGFHYNSENKISEIYARDGRRIFYQYDTKGDLVKVTLPNTAVITYEYDECHRIVQETKPHGKILKNIYDEQGRVKEQRSPMGPEQEIITTAVFEYADDMTTVTDAGEGKTIYKIFQNQIYKVIDPLGYSTLQSWFIDETSWFDAEKEQICEWDQEGGAIRSLKSTNDKRGLTTYYLYDHRANPIENGLEGKDLTGNGESIIRKKCSYNDSDLCIEEEVSGQKTTTIYDSTFPYLPKRIERYSEDTLISYVDVTYNSFGQIETEDHSGAITLWKYNRRGHPCQKTQLTQTDDPDVITIYSYNDQGQCIEMISPDNIQKNEYDLMGNLIASKVFTPNRILLSATYIGYDLNNAPIWEKTANQQHIAYFDYHASGLLKATRKALSPYRFAYTLYEYDPRGYLIEETDPRGYCIYREYDALGKVITETKEGLSTFFSYEPGGFIETITSSSGAQTTRRYTTNGLLKEEEHPDGTKNTVIYDLFGRPVLETNNDLVWELQYNDAQHQIVRTHLKTNNQEIKEFDIRGNLIRFTDADGYTSEKTYDGLNRIKTEITPGGQKTTWNYVDDLCICRLPNGEMTTNRYAGGKVVESKVTNPEGALITTSIFHYDPKEDREEIIEGEETTIAWMNGLGLPSKIQKGSIITTHEYDPCGNCIASTDGEGRTTRYQFDGLSRQIQKELPDGSLITYRYDKDSNLIEYGLPNGNIWKASYDNMRRKCFEEMQSGSDCSNCWEFIYNKGYLTEAIDPMGHTHAYLYDLYGRLIQHHVDGWCKSYTYDARGFLVLAEQSKRESPSWLSSWIYPPNNDHSRVERAYDADGNLSLESIYLNDCLIQETRQTRNPFRRSLQINNHQRDFVYENNRLVQVSTQNVALSYGYDLEKNLKYKQTPWSATTITYNSSALPESVFTELPEGSYQEFLQWHPSGKLSTYSAPGQQQQFIYNARGYLENTSNEQYDFDFGSIGTGVRTGAPHFSIPQDGLDNFGRIINSTIDKDPCITNYNPMGQVIFQNQRQFEWDPWGRLLKVTDPSFTWEASYDALGRRLQTRYTQGWSSSVTITSFYDPEEEFQEIGIQVGNKTFWKIYGPQGCDALVDETGHLVTLLYNHLRQLTGIISEGKTFYNAELPSAYGPQCKAPSIPLDLLSYARSLTWHSKGQDPTGLIWMGARYYDPQRGNFLSPDPVSYPFCLDLYSYANGDPINYMDPDGRFSSEIYAPSQPTVIDKFYLFSGLQPARALFNTTVSYFANHKMRRSGGFEMGDFDLPNGSIGWTNGINNTLDQSMESAQQISQYAQGAKVYGIYNSTNWIFNDIFECLVGHLGFHSPPVQLLKNKWDYLIKIHSPEAIFLEMCHSGGADQIYNALASSPREVRQRIMVLAFAPSVIIPNKLCYRSFNYTSRHDFVTRADFWGNIKYGEELQVLEPHPNAGIWDHEFLSPTFDKVKKDQITNYIENYAGRK